MRRLNFLVAALFAGLFLASCDKGDDNSLTFDFNAAELVITTSEKIVVSGGEQPYTAKSSDETIAKVTVDGNGIYIEALKEGVATITVTDKSGKQGQIIISVAKPLNWEEADGEDVTSRILWNDFIKREGTDAGVYSLTKGGEKTVAFKWDLEDEGENTAELTLNDPNGLISLLEVNPASVRDSAPIVGKLVITKDGTPKEYALSAWSLMQKKNIEGDWATCYWIAFKADGKWGYFVGNLIRE